MPKLTLTFDNGPTPGVTGRVLDTLAARGLKATFFVIGEKLLIPEGRALAEETRARGHWLGSHTMTHGEPLGLLGDPAREVSEIADAQHALGELYAEQKFFRPTGHGRVGPHLLSQAAADYLAAGSYTVALWSLFVRDSKMPDGWADRALDRLGEREWQALVVHDLPTGAMDELPRFLDTAAERGVEFVQDFPLDCTPMRRGQADDTFTELYVAPPPGAATVRGS